MRKAAGYTQSSLSGKIGIPQNTISEYETGIIQPTYDTIMKISKACGFSNEFKNKDYVLTIDNIDRKQI